MFYIHKCTRVELLIESKLFLAFCFLGTALWILANRNSANAILVLFLLEIFFFSCLSETNYFLSQAFISPNEKVYDP